MAKGKNSYIRKKDTKRIKAIKHCLYCGSEDNLMIDHIIPPSRGGNSELENLTRSCNSCNASKSNRTISEFLEHIKERESLALSELFYCHAIIKSIENNIYRNV
jgi:5-methylcytosine-specific restriction endonuclease McrA